MLKVCSTAPLLPVNRGAGLCLYWVWLSLNKRSKLKVSKVDTLLWDVVLITALHSTRMFEAFENASWTIKQYKWNELFYVCSVRDNFGYIIISRLKEIATTIWIHFTAPERKVGTMAKPQATKKKYYNTNEQREIKSENTKTEGLIFVQWLWGIWQRIWNEPQIVLYGWRYASRDFCNGRYCPVFFSAPSPPTFPFHLNNLIKLAYSFFVDVWLCTKVCISWSIYVICLQEFRLE